MNQLTREFLRTPRRPRLKTVEVPEWDGAVTIRELPHDRAEELQEAIKTDEKNAILHWIIACVVDPETAEPIYSAIPEDIAFLGTQSLVALRRICTACMKFQQQDAGEIAKN